MFSLSIFPSAGFVYQTPVIGQVIMEPLSPTIKQILWQWGNGEEVISYAPTLSASYVYRYPGDYNINAVVDYFSDDEVQQVVLEKNHTSKYAVPDAIEFVRIPSELPLPGERTNDTFKVSLTSSQIDQPLHLILHSQYSRSTPMEFVDSKWSFLVPTWRFEDRCKNWVKTLSVDASPIIDSENNVIGVRGEAEFYYVDDLSTKSSDLKCPLLLTATLQTSGFTYENEAQHYPYPGYANSEIARATTLWEVGEPVVDSIKVTGNYIDDIDLIKWEGIKIPIMITAQTSNGSKTYPELSYPTSNELGAQYPISLSLSGVPPSDYIIDEPEKLYFQATDAEGFRNGGYIFTTITPLRPINTTCILVSADVWQDFNNNSKYEDDLVFPYPRNRRLNPYTWVSNPNRKTLNRAHLTIKKGIDECDGLEYYRRLGLLVEGSIQAFPVPPLSSKQTMMGLEDGFNGIAAMAVDPEDFSVYCVDGETDYLYKFSQDGELIRSYNLSNLYPQLTGGAPFWFHNAENGSIIENLTITLQDGISSLDIVWGQDQINNTYNTNTVTADHVYYDIEGGVVLTPSYISLDKKRNIYISFLNNVHVAKLNANNWSLAKLIIPNELSASPFAVDEYTGDYLSRPTLAETDREDNVWIAYGNSSFNKLIKFDSNGNELVIAHDGYNSPAVPVDICINARNEVWVAWNRGDTSIIHNFGSDGTLLHTINAFYNIQYLALDKHNDLWIAFGNRELGFLDVRTLNIITWSFNTNFSPTIINLNSFTPPEGDFIESSWGGLAVDVNDRLWMIDSVQNKLASFWADPDLVTSAQERRIMKVRPDSVIGFFNDQEDTETYTLSGSDFKSAQAIGDWTGNRWLQKYAFTQAVFNKVERVFAKSKPFSVYALEEPFKFRIHNEEFDMADYLHKLALPQTLRDNPELFQKMADIFGTGDNIEQEYLGTFVYERIANFVDNISDPDLCSPQALKSLQRLVGAETGEGLEFESPLAIQRLIHLLSVPKAKLMGRLYWNFSSLLTSDNAIMPHLPESPLLMGYNITAGTFLAFRNKFALPPKWSIEMVPTLEDPLTGNHTHIYPIEDLILPNYANPLLDNYLIYPFHLHTTEYKRSFSKINWQSPNTTMSPQLSTWNDWHGPHKISEMLFNYLLTRGLFTPLSI
jgi:hypothetical protein